MLKKSNFIKINTSTFADSTFSSNSNTANLGDLTSNVVDYEYIDYVIVDKYTKKEWEMPNKYIDHYYIVIENETTYKTIEVSFEVWGSSKVGTTYVEKVPILRKRS